MHSRGQNWCGLNRSNAPDALTCVFMSTLNHFSCFSALHLTCLVRVPLCLWMRALKPVFLCLMTSLLSDWDIMCTFSAGELSLAQLIWGSDSTKLCYKVLTCHGWLTWQTACYSPIHHICHLSWRKEAVADFLQKTNVNWQGDWIVFMMLFCVTVSQLLRCKNPYSLTCSVDVAQQTGRALCGSLVNLKEVKDPQKL